MICELTGMEIARQHVRRFHRRSRGCHDGCACHRSQRCAHRSHGSSRVPEVLATYAQHQEIPTTEIDYVSETGRVDLAKLDAAITSDTACVLIQSPNFFGTVEDVAAIAEIAHKKAHCSSSPSQRPSHWVL